MQAGGPEDRPGTKKAIKAIKAIKGSEEQVRGGGYSGHKQTQVGWSCQQTKCRESFHNMPSLLLDISIIK